MSAREIPPQDQSPNLPGAGEHRRTGRGFDDRRSQVNPVDKPVPLSPEPEHDAVREGVEKLERVKPY